MDNNEIMLNEDVIEVTEGIATAGFGKGFKAAAGVGLISLGGFALGGFLAYKYAIKPIAAKIKAKRKQQKMDADFDEFEDFEDVEIVD